MRRKCLPVTALLAFLATACAGPQENPDAAQSANEDRGERLAVEGVVRGADQPNQNRWNAKSPWGQTERSAPIEAQRKDPFKVFDNVYYVGFQTVSSYLVTTSDGLVLIDSSYGETVDWLLENVRQVGFDPADIRYVFVTHSHRDHAGGASAIKEMTGARVSMSLEDWQSLEDQNAAQQGSEGAAVLADRDVAVRDGEMISVGDATFTFHFTPGHTAGATSIEYQVRDGDRSYRALTPGGLGLHYAPDWGPTFKESMERLRALGPWDVMLSNHPFLMPRDLADIEVDLLERGSTAGHPAVLGPDAIDGFFETVLAIVDEKLVVEPPTGLPQIGG